MLKKNVILICIVFLSYLLADDPSISIESKYGKGTKVHSVTNVEQGDYYYNENINCNLGNKFWTNFLFT